MRLASSVLFGPNDRDNYHGKRRVHQLIWNTLHLVRSFRLACLFMPTISDPEKEGCFVQNLFLDKYSSPLSNSGEVTFLPELQYYFLRLFRYPESASKLNHH